LLEHVLESRSLLLELVVIVLEHFNELGVIFNLFSAGSLKEARSMPYPLGTAVKDLKVRFSVARSSSYL
jgi:hypothetical protein